MSDDNSKVIIFPGKNWDEMPDNEQVIINWDKHGDLLGIINQRYGTSLFIPRHILINNGIKVSSNQNLDYDNRQDITIQCAKHSLIVARILASHVSDLMKYISCSINDLLKNPIEDSNRKASNNDKEFGSIEL